MFLEGSVYCKLKSKNFRHGFLFLIKRLKDREECVNAQNICVYSVKNIEEC